MNPAIASVAVHVTSRGNHFMVEIGQYYREGFASLGLAASLRIDEIPRREPGRLDLIVAPHEFCPLLLQPELGGDRLAGVLAGVYALNTEQPGSTWFETAVAFAEQCRGVFDVNRLGVEAFFDRGIPARYAPLGYTPLLEEVGSHVDGVPREKPPHCVRGIPVDSEDSLSSAPQSASIVRVPEHRTEWNGNPRHAVAGLSPPATVPKDIDILFLGQDSPKRDRFLARHAETLGRYRCSIVVGDVSKPYDAAHPAIFSGAERNRLLRRSKVLVNVHSSDRHYFEWLRALQCMANHCLVVSEPSSRAEPLVDGRHVVFADLDTLVERCEHYVRNDAEREQITRRAYDLMTGELRIEQTCRAMLDAVAAEDSSNMPRRHGGVKYIFFRARRARSAAANVVRGYVPHLKALRRRLIHKADVMAARLARVAGVETGSASAFTVCQRRRQEIIARLDAPRPEPVLVANGAYARAGRPAVSVIVTVYNYARYLTGCLQSVCAAASPEIPGGIETIVVDDASTDASADVAAQLLEAAQTPICLVRKPSNTGLADSRNLGVRLARAPYVFILDADNYIFPQCLAALYATVHSARCAGAYGIIKKFDDTGGEPLGLLSHIGWDVPKLLTGNYIDAMAMLDRRVLLDVGGYSDDLIRHGWFGWEDYDLWLKLARSGHRLAIHREILAAYRVHASSMIRVTNRYAPALAAHFERKFADLLSEHPAQRSLFYGLVQRRAV